MKIAVNEIYYSFQGEGPTAGQPATFLRLAGCNLHCSFCDTPFAWNFGTDVECRHGTRTFDSRKESHVEEVGVIAEKIIASMERFGFMRLVITGGEPLLQQAAILELIDIKTDPPDFDDDEEKPKEKIKCPKCGHKFVPE